MPKDWLTRGRSLRRRLTPLPKAQARAELHTEGEKTGTTYHDLQRFMALSQMIDSLAVELEDEGSIGFGLAEVINRIMIRDRSAAQALLRRAASGRISVRTAIAELRAIETAGARKDTDATDAPGAIARVMAEIIGKEGLRRMERTEVEPLISTVNSAWISKAGRAAYMTQEDPAYRNHPGHRRFLRDVMVAGFDFDFVVIDFNTSRALSAFEAYIANLHEKGPGTRVIVTAIA